MRVGIAQMATQRSKGSSVELSRPVRPWEFLAAVGPHAGLFGHESGTFEAWVYPLKILREFRMRFQLADRTIPAEKLARTIAVRPESTSILYAGDSFTVRQTLLVPLRQPGAIIHLEVETAEALEVEVSFVRDFQLMWPAALGGAYMNWSEQLKAFAFGEEQKRFFALVGSPTARNPRPEFFTNSAATSESSFSLGRVEKGKHVQLVVLAASFESRNQAERTFWSLSSTFEELQKQAADHYAHFLKETVSLKLPETEMQQAYDWSRVAVLQGFVSNPFLGTGLIAGYRTSGRDARPGFAWFFGRDSLWTALALISAGDFAGARTALDFIAKFQREDGKIPHEISQSASFVPWFKDYPYGYASADATPLYILVMNDYAVQSGDVGFVRSKWDSLWKAYEFLHSTWDERGFARNQDVGHGWVEGGPLLPVRTELYQSGLGVAALRALANLARLSGHDARAKVLESEFVRQGELLNETFWIPSKGIFAFALGKDGARVDEASVLTTVPMWFEVLDPEKADAMISTLAAGDHATDWGMRIISSRSARFGPTGYHYGSVWPLFTGWASVGEYRYHRPVSAYANLRANALLALDGSPGHVTEVLSGSHYEPLPTSSPWQIWSSAMVISPLLRGLLGIHVDATARLFRIAPHVPAHWEWFEIENLRVGRGTVSVAFRRDSDSINLDIKHETSEELTVEFSPAVSLRAELLGTEINGRPVPFDIASSPADQHVSVRFPIRGGRNSLRILLRNDFSLHVPHTLPMHGASSRNLRLVSERWNDRRDRLEVGIEGVPGRTYLMDVRGGSGISKVTGAELIKTAAGPHQLKVHFDGAANSGFIRKEIVIAFWPPPGTRRRPDER